MATLTINGRKVTVDDSFKALTREQQEATVEEIAASMGKASAPASPPPAIYAPFSDPMGSGSADIANAQPQAQEMPYGEQMRKAVGTMARGADNAVRIGANAATLGLADRLAGAMNGTGKDAERALTQQARDAAGPVASTAIDILGGIIPAGSAARAGLTAARFMPKGALGTLGAGVVDGAALGAASGAGNDRNMLREMLIGGAGGGLGSAAGMGISKVGQVVGSMFRKKPEVPTMDALRAAKDTAYSTAEATGTTYSNEALKNSAANLERKFAEYGFDPALQPGAGVALRRVQEDVAKGDPITLKGVDTLRKIAGNAFQPGNKSNNSLARNVTDELDALVANPSNAIAGDATKAASAITEGRNLYRRVAKQEQVDELLGRAGLNAGSAGSGANVDNATRQQLKRMLTDKNMTRGLTLDEISAVREAVVGTPTQNALRLVGKMAPTGIVSGTLGGGAGYAMLGPLGLGIPMAGIAAKTASDAMTRKSVDRLGQIIRAGGTKEAAFGVPTGLEKLSAEKRDAMIRALVFGGAIAGPKAYADQ